MARAAFRQPSRVAYERLGIPLLAMVSKSTPIVVRTAEPLHSSDIENPGGSRPAPGRPNPSGTSRRGGRPPSSPTGPPIAGRRRPARDRTRGSSLARPQPAGRKGRRRPGGSPPKSRRRGPARPAGPGGRSRRSSRSPSPLRGSAPGPRPGGPLGGRIGLRPARSPARGRHRRTQGRERPKGSPHRFVSVAAAAHSLHAGTGVKPPSDRRK